MTTSAPRQPFPAPDTLVVTESGINTAADVQEMHRRGVHAFLVGEAFMRAPDPGALPASHPAATKIAAAPEGAAFVCVGARCSLQVFDPATLPQAGPRPCGRRLRR